MVCFIKQSVDEDLSPANNMILIFFSSEKRTNMFPIINFLQEIAGNY